MFRPLNFFSGLMLAVWIPEQRESQEGAGRVCLEGNYAFRGSGLGGPCSTWTPTVRTITAQHLQKEPGRPLFYQDRPTTPKETGSVGDKTLTIDSLGGLGAPKKGTLESAIHLS